MESEKLAYARGRGLARTDDAYERFTLLIDAQDDVFMTWHGEEAAKRDTTQHSDGTIYDSSDADD